MPLSTKQLVLNKFAHWLYVLGQLAIRKVIMSKNKGVWSLTIKIRDRLSLFARTQFLLQATFLLPLEFISHSKIKFIWKNFDRLLLTTYQRPPQVLHKSLHVLKQCWRSYKLSIPFLDWNLERGIIWIPAHATSFVKISVADFSNDASFKFRRSNISTDVSWMWFHSFLSLFLYEVVRLSHTRLILAFQLTRLRNKFLVKIEKLGREMWSLSCAKKKERIRLKDERVRLSWGN
jgi:hypothetical protein